MFVTTKSSQEELTWLYYDEKIFIFVNYFYYIHKLLLSHIYKLLLDLTKLLLRHIKVNSIKSKSNLIYFKSNLKQNGSNFVTTLEVNLL